MKDTTYGVIAIFGLLLVGCWLIALLSHPVLTMFLTISAVIILPIFLSSGKGDRDYHWND